MQTIVLASQKGGSSKTTLAAHLAVAAEQAGNGPVALIDADPQGSLTAWWNAREAETPALAQPEITDLTGRLLKLRANGYAFVIIDTPPALTDAIRAVVRGASLVIVPVKPSPHDLRAVGGTVELVQGEGKAFVFVATQAKGNALLTVQAVAALSEHGRVAPTLMTDRVDYAASMTDGRTVQETDPRGKSAAEMASLWQFVLDRLDESKKDRKAER